MSAIVYQARNKRMDEIINKNAEDLVFVSDVQHDGIDVNNIWTQRKEKEAFLRDYLDYPSFKYKGQDIPLEGWNDGKINLVFKTAYHSAKKRLENAFS